MITTGLAAPVRHPIAGNLFADPDSSVITCGNDRNRFYFGEGTKYTSVRASTATYLSSNGYLATAAVNESRFDYDPLDSSSLSSGGWLFEDGKTNFVQRSANFGHSYWTKTGCTVTDNTVTAPDGTLAMDTIVEDGTTGAHGVSRSLSVTNANRYAISCWADDINRDWLRIAIADGATTREAWFNVSTGAVGTVNNCDYAFIQGPYRDGRYRCHIQVTINGGTASRSTSFNAADADASNSFTGGTQDSLYIWGAQLEVDHLTSYIPTAGSQVSRSQDQSTLSLSALNTSHFDLYLEMDLLFAPNMDGQLLTPITTTVGANGEQWTLIKLATNQMTHNITDDTGALRFNNFSFPVGDYGEKIGVTVRWNNENTGPDNIKMTSDGAVMPYVSTANAGTEQWTAVPATLQFWDLSRSTAMKLRTLVVGI